MERPFGESWQEVKRRAESGEREPNDEEISREPPSDRCLHDTTNEMDMKQQKSCRQNPRQPEQTREREPLRGLESALGATGVQANQAD